MSLLLLSSLSLFAVVVRCCYLWMIRTVVIVVQQQQQVLLLIIILLLSSLSCCNCTTTTNTTNNNNNYNVIIATTSSSTSSIRTTAPRIATTTSSTSRYRNHPNHRSIFNTYNSTYNSSTYNTSSTTASLSSLSCLQVVVHLQEQLQSILLFIDNQQQSQSKQQQQQQQYSSSSSSSIEEAIEKDIQQLKDYCMTMQQRQHQQQQQQQQQQYSCRINRSRQLQDEEDGNNNNQNNNNNNNNNIDDDNDDYFNFYNVYTPNTANDVEITYDEIDDTTTVIVGTDVIVHVEYTMYYYIYNSIMIFICISIGAIMAGLLMGIMSLDPLTVSVKARSNPPPMKPNIQLTKEQQQERIQQIRAIQLLPFVQNKNLVLVSLLLVNCGMNEALPIFLDALLDNQWMTVLLSLTVVLVVGEIIPSAYFTGKDQMKCAYDLLPILRLVILLTCPISYPLAKCMDYYFHNPAHDEVTAMKRGDITAMVRIQYEEYLAWKRRTTSTSTTTTTTTTVDHHYTTHQQTQTQNTKVVVAAAAIDPQQINNNNDERMIRSSNNNNNINNIEQSKYTKKKKEKMTKKDEPYTTTTHDYQRFEDHTSNNNSNSNNYDFDLVPLQHQHHAQQYQQQQQSSVSLYQIFCVQPMLFLQSTELYACIHPNYYYNNNNNNTATTTTIKSTASTIPGNYCGFNEQQYVTSVPSFPTNVQPELCDDDLIKLEGALSMKDKKVKCAYTIMSNVVSIMDTTILDENMVVQIYSHGYSRIPVMKEYYSNDDNDTNIDTDTNNNNNSNRIKKYGICGIVLTKQLMLIGGKETLPTTSTNDGNNDHTTKELSSQQQQQYRRVSSLTYYDPPCISVNTNLSEALSIILSGKRKSSNMAIVCTNPDIANDAIQRKVPIPHDTAGVLGIITLENILEELIQEPIFDEKDKKMMNLRYMRLGKWVISKWRNFVEKKRYEHDDDNILMISNTSYDDGGTSNDIDDVLLNTNSSNTNTNIIDGNDNNLDTQLQCTTTAINRNDNNRNQQQQQQQNHSFDYIQMNEIV